MGLIVPNGPSFAHWSDNLAFPSGDGLDYGTPVVPGVSSSDGSPVTVLPALAHDCEYLVLGIAGFNTSGQDGAALMDLLVDPAGGTSWSELISDPLCGWTSTVDLDVSAGVSGPPLMYHFPVWAPAGASIGARARYAHSVAPVSPRVIAYAAGGNKNPATWWCGQKVETVGTMDPSNSRGQTIAAGSSFNVAGAADNGSGLIRLTISSTASMTTGDVRRVSGVGGTVEANGIWTITVVSGTTLDLQGSAFVNAFTSGGTVTGNFASWGDLGSPTSARAGALQYGAQSPESAAGSGRVYRYEFGAGSRQIGPCVYRGMNSSETGTHFFHGPVFCDIPAGTQMQARGLCGGASAQSLNCAAYLVQ